MDLKDLSSNQLARLCAVQGGSEEWREFVQRFTRPLSMSVYRVARMWGESSAAVVDDIVQDIFLKFCENDRKVLREFVPRHEDSFVAFARVVAAGTANDYFRKRNTVKRGGGAQGKDVSDALPGVFHGTEWMERNMLLLQIDRLLENAGTTGTGRRDRIVFWLYYQQGMTAGAIAALPGISLTVKGVESALHRTTALIRSHLRQRPVAPVQKNLPVHEGFEAQSAIPKGKWQ